MRSAPLQSKPGKTASILHMTDNGCQSTVRKDLMITMCYSGNLGLSHDLGTIVRAAKLANARSEFCIHFVGNGKAKRSLYDLAAQLELMNIGFYPPVPLHKLRKMLSEGDVHFVAQKKETTGLVVPSKIYGIMAVGRPTILIGPHDCEVGIIIRESRSGMIVPPGDVEGAANAIVELSGNGGLRKSMGARARQYYQEYLSQERGVAQIIQIIEKTQSVQPLQRSAIATR